MAGVGPGQHAGQDRDAHRAAGLAGQVVERRSHSLLGGGQGRGDAAGGRGHGQAQPGPERDQPDGYDQLEDWVRGTLSAALLAGG
ncbi:MAG: hypothetical protein ACRDP5_00820 [Streptosporangiaceae bacterium]